MNIFAELKRRNVFRVGAAYAVVGWVLLQAAEILLANFGMPEWVFKSFAALLVLGLLAVYRAAVDAARRAVRLAQLSGPRAECSLGSDPRRPAISGAGTTSR